MFNSVHVSDVFVFAECSLTRVHIFFLTDDPIAKPSSLFEVPNSLNTSGRVSQHSTEPLNMEKLT